MFFIFLPNAFLFSVSVGAVKLSAYILRMIFRAQRVLACEFVIVSYIINSLHSLVVSYCKRTQASGYAVMQPPISS
jgi:hypothetical protein